MFHLQSERLNIVPLTHEQLLLTRSNLPAFEQQTGLAPSAIQADDEFFAEMADAMQNFWLPNTRLYPDLYQWYTNWQIILKSENRIIGNIGFAGYPNDYGETLVGYMISKPHQGNGYAIEALRALVNWGFSFSTLKVIKADTTIDNKASQKVLTNVGFRWVSASISTLHYQLNKF